MLQHSLAFVKINTGKAVLTLLTLQIYEKQ